MADFASLAAGGRPGLVSQCALVLEDNPVGADSRLVFESFQQELEMTYAVAAYEELGAKRMPQPGYVAYRGGNWSTFQIRLTFIAGSDAVLAGSGGFTFDPATAVTSPDIERLLIEMERKVRWCEALAFPLERGLGAAGQRILARAKANNVLPTAAATEAVGKLKRNDPPIVLVVFGSWTVIRCYVTQTNTKWGAPWHPMSVRPYTAGVTLTFQPQMAEYPTWQTIRNQAGVGGFTTANPAFRGAVVPLEVRQARLRGRQLAAANAEALARRRAQLAAEGGQAEG
jgi:hypothetical protein